MANEKDLSIELKQEIVSNSIIMTPEHAKRLFLALQDNINKYESQFGPISLGGEQPKQTFPMGGFGNGAKS